MTNYSKRRTNSKQSHYNQERCTAVCPLSLSFEAVPATENSVPSCISYSITVPFPQGKHSVCYRELLTTSVHPDQQGDVCRAHEFPLPTTSPMCCLRSQDTKPHSVPCPISQLNLPFQASGVYFSLHSISLLVGLNVSRLH